MIVCTVPTMPTHGTIISESASHGGVYSYDSEVTLGCNQDYRFADGTTKTVIRCSDISDWNVVMTSASCQGESVTGQRGVLWNRCDNASWDFYKMDTKAMYKPKRYAQLSNLNLTG